MRQDTNFKGSDLSCPSIYYLFYDHTVSQFIQAYQGYFRTRGTNIGVQLPEYKLALQECLSLSLPYGHYQTLRVSSCSNAGSIRNGY